MDSDYYYTDTQKDCMNNTDDYRGLARIDILSNVYINITASRLTL